VVAHHGSLSRSVREEAEQVTKESKVAVCVATSTLEIGIDIGDIDLVVLAEVPWSISSLLQRIGRGNRKEDVIHAAAVVSTREEKALIEKMFQLASRGVLPSDPYEPDRSVAVQQILSCLFQHPGGVNKAGVLYMISPLCSDLQAEAIVSYLHTQGWVEIQGQRLYASTRLMDLGERGLIHSNIPDEEEYTVLDNSTGKEIGSISGEFDQLFTLAGKMWKVISVKGKTIIVERHPKGAHACAPFG